MQTISPQKDRTQFSLGKLYKSPTTPMVRFDTNVETKSYNNGSLEESGVINQVKSLPKL